MSEMTERVGRAICKGANSVMPPDVRPDCEQICSMCDAEARAAIEAMREPTEAMYSIVYNPEHGITGISQNMAGIIWQAMIKELDNG